MLDLSAFSMPYMEMEKFQKQRSAALGTAEQRLPRSPSEPTAVSSRCSRRQAGGRIFLGLYSAWPQFLGHSYPYINPNLILIWGCPEVPSSKVCDYKFYLSLTGQGLCSEEPGQTFHSIIQQNGNQRRLNRRVSSQGSQIHAGAYCWT